MSTDDHYPSRDGVSREIERVDPVVYQPLDRVKPADLAFKLRSYARDGFLFLPDLFPEAEARKLLAEAEAMQARDGQGTFREQGGSSVRSIFAVHRTSKVFSALSRDQRLLSLVRAILDDDVYVHQSRINYKPAFSGREFYWHSDFETWHAEDGMPRMRALSVSVLLTPSYVTNGPLMLIPGSHTTFVSCAAATPEDHYKQSLVRQEVGTPGRDVLKKMAMRRGIKLPTGGPGSVVLFDCNVMHGSNGNITPFPRTSLFVVYNAVSNRLVAPFATNAPRPEYIASREHMETLSRRSE